MGNNNVNLIYDKKNNKVLKSKRKPSVKKKLVNEEINIEINKTTVLSPKERNRRRYQSRQQRYNSKQTKKKVIDIEINNTNISTELDNQNKDKKLKNNDFKIEKNLKTKKNKEQNEKKIIQRLKNIQLSKIMTLESNIPLSTSKNDTKIRIKKYLKESVIMSIIITIINLLAILIFKNVNVLKLFDVNFLNICLTILLSLLISFIIAFFINCLITEIWVKIKAKRVGEANDNSRVEQRKNRENI